MNLIFRAGAKLRDITYIQYSDIPFVIFAIICLIVVYFKIVQHKKAKKSK